MIRSVLEIGRNQRVKYAEIFSDMSFKRIAGGDVGCALVAVPYFHLARDAHDEDLLDQTIDDWVTKKRARFLVVRFQINMAMRAPSIRRKNGG